MDFLAAYRLDKSLSDAMERMSQDEQVAYLQEYTGWELDQEAADLAEAKKASSPIIEDHVRKLERTLCHLWEFVWQEGLGDEAREFVEERKDEEVSFEW